MGQERRTPNHFRIMSKHSVAQFVKLSQDGTLDTNKAKVYRYVSFYGTNLDVARRHTKMPHQTLTAALSHLMDDGIVRQLPDGRFVSVAVERAEHYAWLRKRERYVRWKKRGEAEGFFEWDNLDQATA